MFQAYIVRFGSWRNIDISCMMRIIWRREVRPHPDFFLNAMEGYCSSLHQLRVCCSSGDGYRSMLVVRISYNIMAH